MIGRLPVCEQCASDTDLAELVVPPVIWQNFLSVASV